MILICFFIVEILKFIEVGIGLIWNVCMWLFLVVILEVYDELICWFVVEKGILG